MGAPVATGAAGADSVPELVTLARGDMSELALANWRASGLSELGAPAQEWTSGASAHALGYATHGLFRYFGKSPPVVARHLLRSFTEPGDAMLDPMVGSGTSAVEALLLGRGHVGADVSPLSCLLTRVKTRRLARERAVAALEGVLAEAARAGPAPADAAEVDAPGLGEIALERFFLPETRGWLRTLRAGIDAVDDQAARELLQAALAAITRRVSRATSQQGRLFLDPDTAEPDPRPRFERIARKAAARLAELPARAVRFEVHHGDARTLPLERGAFPLVFCHPPYFNGYRYSRIFSLELAWLGLPVAPVRRSEVREFFKVGRPDNAARYVEDMAVLLEHLAPSLAPDGTLALMVGDTVLKGERIAVTRSLLDRVAPVLEPTLVAVRTPRFTEASWVASQRREGEKVGARLCDFVVLLRRAKR